MCFNYQQMDMLVTYSASDIEPFTTSLQKGINRTYLTHPIFAYSYPEEKKQIVKFLSESSAHSESKQTLESFKKQLQSSRTCSRQGLLRNRKFSNSQSIMILKGEALQTRILLESLTQHEAPEFQVMVYHASLKHNQITCDCYFLMKHIVFRLAQVPLIYEYLMLQTRDLYYELTQKWDSDSLQEATAQVFLDFLKVISNLSLSCNLVVLVHGAENLFTQNDLSNFIYVLRAAGDQMPAFLKFVFAVELRTNNFHVLNKIVNLLRTKQIVTLDTDQDPLLEESSLV